MALIVSAGATRFLAAHAACEVFIANHCPVKAAALAAPHPGVRVNPRDVSVGPDAWGRAGGDTEVAPSSSLAAAAAAARPVSLLAEVRARGTT